MKLPAKKTPNRALCLVICLTQAARTFSWDHINWNRRKDETSKISSKDHNFMFQYFVLDIYSNASRSISTGRKINKSRGEIYWY